MSITDEVSQELAPSLRAPGWKLTISPRSVLVLALSSTQPDRKRLKSRGQMVWQPEEGFLSKSTLDHRAGTSISPRRAQLVLPSPGELELTLRSPSLASSTAPPPLPTSNAAERILLALESMRSPLLDARRHHPTVPAAMTRSTSLPKIHVPSAAAREREQLDKRRDTMISPYGRVREKKEKDRSEVRGSGLRKTLSRRDVEDQQDEEHEQEEIAPPTPRRGGARAAKSKGKGKEKDRQSEDTRMDEDETRESKIAQLHAQPSLTPAPSQQHPAKRRQPSKRRQERDEDTRMAGSQGEPSPAYVQLRPRSSRDHCLELTLFALLSSSPPSPQKQTELSLPDDDSAFQPLAPVASNDPTARARSALRARSTTSRKHVSAVNSRSGTPGPSGRFSAREEDIPADEDLGALDKIKFVMPGAPSGDEATKKTLNGAGSLLSRMDAPAPIPVAATPSFLNPTPSTGSSASSTASSRKPSATNPFGAPSAAATSGASTFSFATNTPPPPPIAPAAAPAAASGVPNFFGSALAKADVSTTPVAPPPKKSFSLGLGAPPATGSTTPSAPPPSKSPVPNFFGAAPAKLPTPPPAAGAFLFGKPTTSMPPTTAAPAAAAPASNPFAGVGVAKDAVPALAPAPVPAPAAPSSLAVETKANPSPFGGFGSFGSASSTEAPKSNVSQLVPLFLAIT